LKFKILELELKKTKKKTYLYYLEM